MRLTPSIALVGSGDARLTDRYDCNVYLVDAPDGPVLVDTGGGRDTARILERARRTFGEPAVALVTHAHADHSQGGPDLQRREIPVVAPEPSEGLLEAGNDRDLGLDVAKRDGVYPEDYTFEHYSPDRTIAPGETFELAGRTFEAVSLRGHSADHVCYLTEVTDRVACFVGDAIYPDGSISLLNVPGSSLAGYRADIDNLADRDIDALLTGHDLPRLDDAEESIAQAGTNLAGMYSPPSRT